MMRAGAAAIATTIAIGGAIGCGGSASVASTPTAPATTSATPATPAATMTLTSSAGADGGTLPADYTCDGTSASPPLAWTGAPTGTKEFVLLMTTLPGDGTTKWNWIMYNIPATTSALERNTAGIGRFGVGSDGPSAAYQPPCSLGPGLKLYTFTIYALSGAPVFTVPASQITGAVVTSAIASLTIGRGSLTLGYTRPR